MTFWEKVKCTTGFHDWSEWTYIKPKRCEQTRYCKRGDCTKTESQVAHTWNQWSHAGPGKCDEERGCVRCEETERRTDHLWDVWRYESPTSCVQVRFCRRCDTGIEKKEPQSLSDHGLSPSDLPKVSCDLRSGPCPRCKETVNMTLFVAEHEWGPWEGRAGSRQRTCRRCHTHDFE